MKFVEGDPNRFHVDGEQFVIDTSAGANRRKSDAEAFTIVKTRRFLDIYAKAAEGQQGRKLLELGIFEGGSLVLFDKLFRPAKMVGVDLKKNSVPALDDYVAKRGGAVKTYYGTSQDDVAAMTRVVDSDFGGEIDIVVDDASHLYEQTKASFQILFPRLSAGGIYIIEDWAWSFQAPYQNAKHDWYGRTAMASLIFELIADVAISPAIDNIQIFKELAIIKKGAAKAGKVAFGDAHYRGRGAPKL